jgi:transposase-like protein
VAKRIDLLASEIRRSLSFEQPNLNLTVESNNVVNRFGRHFADCIRRDRPRPNDKWHMDEVVITVRGKKHWLWRAIDARGDVLDILVQMRRNAKAARRFFQRLVAQFGEPRVVITLSHDIAAQCTAGQWTSCAVTSNRSRHSLRTLTIALTRA